MRAFWDVAPCSFEVDRRFKGAYCLHHHGDPLQRDYTSIYPRWLSYLCSPLWENLKSYISLPINAVLPHTYGGAEVERLCRSYSFTTSELDGGGEWSASCTGRALPPGKGLPVPIVQEAGWAQQPVWTQEVRGKILLPLPDIEPWSPGRPVRKSDPILTELPGSYLCLSP
jgi:hypothetical protein